MKQNRLPIMNCHANCPKCGLPSEFKMFESGLGGDFETYVGGQTGAIYRLDLGKVHYQGKQKEDLFKEAVSKENHLTCIPQEIRCKICGTVFKASHIMCDGEELIEAFDI